MANPAIGNGVDNSDTSETLLNDSLIDRSSTASTSLITNTQKKLTICQTDLEQHLIKQDKSFPWVLIKRDLEDSIAELQDELSDYRHHQEKTAS